MEVIIRCGFQSFDLSIFRDKTISKGRKLSESCHISDVHEVIRKDIDFRLISGTVLRETPGAHSTRKNENFYKPSIKVNTAIVILDTDCNCKGGKGYCKHAAAVCIYVNAENIQSKTDQPLTWHKPSQAQLDNSRLRRKTSKNCTKSEIRLRDKNSLSKFSIVCYLLGHIYKLLKKQETCTKRELYYRNVEVLNSQKLVDSALNEISCLLDASLYDLNVHTTSKGLIYGQVILKTSTEETNCSSIGGTLIPNDVSDITDIKTDASFILLIEKDTIFQRLLDDETMKSLPPCIFITGKGFPDINTRILLRKMWNILAIPIFALVDPDPWGIEIMCIYRFGSLSMAHEGEQLAVPSIRWLGVFPSETGALSAGRTALTATDRKRLEELLRRPYAHAAPRLAHELRTAAFKAETENVDVPPGYLAHKYIPSKIATADFI